MLHRFFIVYMRNSIRFSSGKDLFQGWSKIKFQKLKDKALSSPDFSHTTPYETMQLFFQVVAISGLFAAITMKSEKPHLNLVPGSARRSSSLNILSASITFLYSTFEKNSSYSASLEFFFSVFFSSSSFSPFTDFF